MTSSSRSANQGSWTRIIEPRFVFAFTENSPGLIDGLKVIGLPVLWPPPGNYSLLNALFSDLSSWGDECDFYVHWRGLVSVVECLLRERKIYTYSLLGVTFSIFYPFFYYLLLVIICVLFI